MGKLNWIELKLVTNKIYGNWIKVLKREKKINGITVIMGMRYFSY